MITRKKVSIFFLIVLLSISGGVILGAYSYYSVESTVQVGDKFPEVTFIDSRGNGTSLDDYLGRRVLVVFVDLGCGSCQALLKKLKADYDNSDTDPVFIISIATSVSIMPINLPTVKEGPIPLWSDPQRHLYKKLGTARIPACFLIDKDGTILYIGVGKKALQDVENIASGNW